jgi:uncharacterized protein (TIGR00106 family)
LTSTYAEVLNIWEVGKMAMIDISVVPVGTAGPSVSDYVAGAVRILQKEKGIKYELTAMNTIIEGDLDKLMALAQRMHRSAFDAGAKRVVTTIRIDERRDKALTIEGKIKAVKDKLGGNVPLKSFPLLKGE